MDKIVKGMVNGVGSAGQGVGQATTCPFNFISKPDAMKHLENNASSNLDVAQKACPIVGECRDVGEGIALGDFTKGAFNAGVLALYSIRGGVAVNTEVKVAMKTTSKKIVATNFKAITAVKSVESITT